MTVNYQIKICDICKKKIEEVPVLFKSALQYLGPINIPYQDGPHKTVKHFEEICTNCRDRISDFIMKELYSEKQHRFEVYYDNKKMKEVHEDEQQTE